MPDDSGSIRRFYDGWATYNERIVDVVRELTADQLALRPAPDRWPMWATIGHTAGTRTYWLCGVLGEPGAETTPFPDPLSGVGWEDDEDNPRGAEELVMAWDTTWRIIAGCLDRWTPVMLQDEFVRETPLGKQIHTRQSVLMRLISHEAYHAGELSQTLGIHGLRQIDLWQPVYVVLSPNTHAG
jgi:uncharacterized damage-inducible protein DinB